MQWFDNEGQSACLVNADKKANAFANYNTEHKYFIPWTVAHAMHILCT